MALPQNPTPAEMRAAVKTLEAELTDAARQDTLLGVQTDMTAVKTLLGTANPTSADMATVMNALKKIHDIVIQFEDGNEVGF